MTTYKVAELEGHSLAHAVAMANGWRPGPDDNDWRWIDPAGGRWVSTPLEGVFCMHEFYRIVESERISIILHGDGTATACVRARYDSGKIMGCDAEEHGPTPLAAAMRAFVSSCFGEEIEL